MLGKKMFAAMDAYTGCHLFDAAGGRVGITATHHRFGGNSMLRWQAKKSPVREQIAASNMQTCPDEGEIEATMQQTIKMGAWHVTATSNLSTFRVGQHA
jgi:hypothetical protein